MNKLKDKKIIKYNIDDFTKIERLEDFYKQTGLYDKLMNSELTVFDIHMNREECEMLNSFMKVTNRKKMKKLYAEKYIDTSVAMHWLNYAPMTNNAEVPKGELWIYKDGKEQ